MRMTIVSGTQRCAILNLEQRVRVIKCDHAVQLCTCSVCGCTEATETCPNSGKQNFPNRQGLKNTEKFQVLVFLWVWSHVDDDDEAVCRLARDPDEVVCRFPRDCL